MLGRVLKVATGVAYVAIGVACAALGGIMVKDGVTDTDTLAESLAATRVTPTTTTADRKAA